MSWEVLICRNRHHSVVVSGYYVASSNFFSRQTRETACPQRRLASFSDQRQSKIFFAYGQKAGDSDFVHGIKVIFRILLQKSCHKLPVCFGLVVYKKDGGCVRPHPQRFGMTRHFMKDLGRQFLLTIPYENLRCSNAITMIFMLASGNEFQRLRRFVEMSPA